MTAHDLNVYRKVYLDLMMNSVWSREEYVYVNMKTQKEKVSLRIEDEVCFASISMQVTCLTEEKKREVKRRWQCRDTYNVRGRGAAGKKHVSN